MYSQETKKYEVQDWEAARVNVAVEVLVWWSEFSESWIKLKV